MMKFLTRERKRQGLSTFQLCEKMGWAVATSTLKDWECGKHVPRSLDKMETWARTLGYELGLIRRGQARQDGRYHGLDGTDLPDGIMRAPDAFSRSDW